MLVVTVMYPQSGGETFNHDYYANTHMKLVRDRWSAMGLQDAKIFRAVGTPDGSPASYGVTAVLTFASQQAFQEAVRAHGKEIFDDIPNFTNTKPLVQLNEPFG